MIQTQDDTTYIGASVTKKEYEWRTVLSSTSQFTEGLLYVPYNWDKTTTGPYPEFNLIFNDVNINNRVIGKYKDQANVGSYGTLGYGVLIYNVTDCIRNGRNTLPSCARLLLVRHALGKSDLDVRSILLHELPHE